MAEAPPEGTHTHARGSRQAGETAETTVEPEAVATQPEDDGHGFAAAAREAWHDERVEIVAAILLSLATVLSAWGAYQATRWGGEQANSYAGSANLRAEAGRHGTAASRQIQIDVATFLAWTEATEAANESLAGFVEQRFRPEFKVAFDTWLAKGTSDAAGLPPGTPFDEADYTLAEQTLADQKLKDADAALLDAQTANQIGDDFVLTAVLFASVLFFAGMAARFRPQWIRWSMLGVALVVFVIGLLVEFSLPQNVGF